MVFSSLRLLFSRCILIEGNKIAAARLLLFESSIYWFKIILAAAAEASMGSWVAAPCSLALLSLYLLFAPSGRETLVWFLLLSSWKDRKRRPSLLSLSTLMSSLATFFESSYKTFLRRRIPLYLSAFHWAKDCLDGVLLLFLLSRSSRSH